MAAAGVPALDLFSFTRSLEPDLYCDHVHFREEVRARQAAFIADGLVRWQREGWPFRSSRGG